MNQSGLGGLFPHPARRASRLAAAAILGALLGALAGCGGPEKLPVRPRTPSAEQVELNFHGKRFILGDDNAVALVRPPSWPKDRFLRLPFWLGTNILLPGVLQPSQGDYYVISEARLIRKVGGEDEWLIEAGSSLIKKETVFITTKTHYKSAGRILPTIVQYIGTREFKTAEGRTVEVPVLREVSLPMEWTFAGPLPKAYAKFEIR